MSVSVSTSPKDKLTPTRGERLFIWRRRNKFSQREAAEALGVSRDKYWEWERDVRSHDQPHQQIGKLKLNEVCVVLRRRKGVTQAQLAEALGVSRVWVVNMEEGRESPTRLCQYWGVEQ